MRSARDHGSRRRAIAAAATAVAAVALAAAVAGRGCGSEDDTPVGAVRAFAAAARAGDREAMFELLAPATQARLEDAAGRASNLVSARRYLPQDMISLAGPGEPRSFELRSEAGGRAVVDAIDDRGGRTSIELVEVDGRWRIEL